MKGSFQAHRPQPGITRGSGSLCHALSWGGKVLVQRKQVLVPLWIVSSCLSLLSCSAHYVSFHICFPIIHSCLTGPVRQQSKESPLSLKLPRNAAGMVCAGLCRSVQLCLVRPPPCVSGGNCHFHWLPRIPWTQPFTLFSVSIHLKHHGSRHRRG